MFYFSSLVFLFLIVAFLSPLGQNGILGHAVLFLHLQIMVLHGSVTRVNTLWCWKMYKDGMTNQPLQQC